MNVPDGFQSTFRSGLHLHVPTLARLHKLPKHPISTQGITRKGEEITISPDTPSRNRVSYSPASSPTELTSKHFRSSTVSPRGFKFIAATATSPFEEFQTPATDFPNSEISESLCSSLSLEEEPHHTPIYTSPRRSHSTSLVGSDPANLIQEERFKVEVGRTGQMELQEKISTATRLTTNSVEERGGFEVDLSILNRKIYCDRCEKNVSTECLFRNAEKSLWEKFLCGVCFKGLGSSFKEIVHFCGECGNEVALIRYKQEETYQ